ncbi:hypothetical protein K9U40_12285 [Xanthobacter autotrophicus]|uniref:hypothetical protein n=1 Tax=Xanthobacter TaxID=279 RepID=UPI0024AB2C4E|nr:hypothetical protein [Xanthobacter autotrophicus]MDI4665100.1 hypothetical protein [Xanthobacter autotrophicus]
MSGRCDMEVGHFSLGRLDRPGAGVSSADPEVLARAVRDHKIGDALAQAGLTFALMLAIGAVAFVLSAEHAAASQLIVNGVIDNSAVLLGLAMAGSAFLLGRHAARRFARVRIMTAGRRDAEIRRRSR